MAALLRRRSSGQNLPLMDPSCEFGDIHSRMSQLLNLACLGHDRCPTSSAAQSHSST